MDTDRVRQLVRLKVRKDELETKLKAVKAEIDKLSTSLVDEFAEDGVAHAAVDGHTAYLHRQLWASAAGEKTDLVAALQRNGLGHFVSPSFNTNTLSAYVREVDETGEELPKDLREQIKVSEVWTVRVRKT